MFPPWYVSPIWYQTVNYSQASQVPAQVDDFDEDYIFAAYEYYYSWSWLAGDK
jgi:hypothetical protein